MMTSSLEFMWIHFFSHQRCVDRDLVTASIYRLQRNLWMGRKPWQLLGTIRIPRLLMKYEYNFFSVMLKKLTSKPEQPAI